MGCGRAGGAKWKCYSRTRGRHERTRRREGYEPWGLSNPAAPQSATVNTLKYRRRMRVAGSVNGQFWLLASVAAAGLLAWALQWRASTQAEDRPQIATVTQVAAPAPQPQHGASGASERADADRKSPGPLRPQPPLGSGAATNGQPALHKRQFALLGTTLTGDRHMALIREIVSGESRVVDEGAQLGSMTVAVVQADRVLLRSSGYTEELQLQKDSVAQAPLVAPVPTSTFDVAADASRSERAPMASPTSDDVRALLEQGMPVPNPD